MMDTGMQMVWALVLAGEEAQMRLTLGMERKRMRRSGKGLAKVGVKGLNVEY